MIFSVKTSCSSINKFLAIGVGHIFMETGVQLCFSISVHNAIFYRQYVLFSCILQVCCQNMSLKYIDFDISLKPGKKTIFLFFWIIREWNPCVIVKYTVFSVNLSFCLLKIQYRFRFFTASLTIYIFFLPLLQHNVKNNSLDMVIGTL